MLKVLMLFYFLHQSQGYGLKVQAHVDIGDESLAAVFEELVKEYLRNGQAQIDISDFVQRVQMLASTPAPQNMALMSADNRKENSVKISDLNSDFETKTAKISNHNTDKEKKNTEETEQIIISDDFTDDSNETGKKVHKIYIVNKVNKQREIVTPNDASDKKNKSVFKSDKRHSSDEFVSSDHSNEVLGEKSTEFEKISNKESGEFDELSDGSMEKSIEEHALRKIKRSEQGSDESREINQSDESEKAKSHSYEFESKERQVIREKNSNEISSEELKEKRGTLHIFGVHGIEKDAYKKYPLNNIKV